MHMSELVSQLPGTLQRYQPSLRYFLLDENRSSDLARQLPDNSVASLIEIEEGASPQAIKDAVTRLRIRLSGPEHASLQRALTVWLNRVILKRINYPDNAFPETENLQEVEIMLADRMKKWERDFERAGMQKWMQEGLQKGLQQGLQQGQASLLGRQLSVRFGPLPEWAVKRLEQATPEQINHWAEAIFDTLSLEELLGQSDTAP